VTSGDDVMVVMDTACTCDIITAGNGIVVVMVTTVACDVTEQHVTLSDTVV